MLEAIKRIFQQKSGNALAEYYQSRLHTTKSIIEAEAIIYMNSLMSLYDWEEGENEELK